MKCCRWVLIIFATILLVDFVLLNVIARAQTLTDKLAVENPLTLATEARRDGDIVRGAILFHQGNIDCAKCHRPAADQARIGPDLSRMNPDATDEFIVESILQPSKQINEDYKTFIVLNNDGQIFTGIKVSESENQIVLRDSEDITKLVVIDRENLDEIRLGTESSMPQGLTDQLKNRQQFLDLLLYVIDIKERGPNSESYAIGTNKTRELSREDNGLLLIQKLNCIACHTSDFVEQPVAAKKAPRLQWSARSLNPDYLAAFIANPHLAKPGSTMPELFGQMDEVDRKTTASAITHFLLSKTDNEFQFQPIDDAAVSRGFELFHSVGCVACHSPRNELAEEQRLVESAPLGSLAEKYNIDGLTEFLEDPLLVRPSGHMPNMQLTYHEAVDIANFLLQATPENVTNWKHDPELVKQGETLFAQHNCQNCHTDFVDMNPSATVNLTLEKLNSQQGCLSGQTGGWPNFHLQDHERESIQTALQQSPAQLTDRQKIDITLVSYNCIACHDRGGLGGVDPIRNPHFQTTNQNLGEQGRIPPTLTGVGAKLKLEWMRDVLVNHRSIRPYMNTRMPQFGEENIAHLVDLFEADDQLPETNFARFDDQKAMREKGHLLAGDKGLNCVACHTYQYEISDTMPAVDLTEMTDRLRKDWFYQYMMAPQTFSLNTVMPSFWPGGQAIRKDIEGGPEDQIEALWQYLIDGRQARAPSGVIKEPLEIVVTDEAQMLRRSYPGIGKRGIGVGYPGGVNIAFDAEQMRLGAVWRGDFAEASGVWRGQGSGTVRPMSRPIEFVKGPELDSANSPWVVDDGRPPGHQFKGYVLDKSQRPTFRYVYDLVEVEDFFEQVLDESAGTTRLRRSVTMSSEAQHDGLCFRVFAAANITGTDGTFSVANKFKIKIISEHTAQIVADNEGERLEVPIGLLPDKKQQLVIEYIWE